METTAVATQASIVKYSFILPNGTCSARIAVQTTPGQYSDDGSGKTYKGYALVKGGDITFQAPGQAAPTTLPFIAHAPGGQDSQVLWADGCGVPGGSQNGLSQNGPYFGGGLPSLNWISGPNFQLNLGTVAYDMRLNSCEGWPIPVGE